jgi:hypothetical protein
MALTSGGELYAWGSGESNRLGMNDTSDKLVPTYCSVDGGKRLTHVAVSNGRLLAFAPVCVSKVEPGEGNYVCMYVCVYVCVCTCVLVHVYVRVLCACFMYVYSRLHRSV